MNFKSVFKDELELFIKIKRYEGLKYKKTKSVLTLIDCAIIKYNIIDKCISKEQFYIALWIEKVVFLTNTFYKPALFAYISIGLTAFYLFKFLICEKNSTRFIYVLISYLENGVPCNLYFYTL